MLRTDLSLPSGTVIRGKEWELGVSRCKLLHTGWISNKPTVAPGTMSDVLG